MKPEEDFVYCSNWKCDRTNCARHHYNQPWNVLLYSVNTNQAASVVLDIRQLKPI